MCSILTRLSRHALSSIVCVLIGRSVSAQSLVCAFPDHYPGDNAAPSTIAAWMAGRAAARGVPKELPVMAALVESGLQNAAGDADSVGFFQMRVSTWDKGVYAGYSENPELQVRWFVDQAIATLNRATLSATRGYVDGPEGYGRWISDVIGRSAESSRAMYQMRLDDARGLIDEGRRLAGSWPFEGVDPGDDVAAEMLAAWMATGAHAAGLPPELPIMAALVESGLRNLPSDGDRAGYFGMRASLWNVRPYVGFADRPALQLKWFIDQAHAARRLRIAAGDAFFGADPGQFGEWIADVERPAEQYRELYQLRLAQARSLMRGGCAALLRSR
jgi:hypothetical protein